MKTKLFLLILAVIVGISTASAESGKCGANLTWDLTDGILTISGTGEMTDYTSSSVPWYSFRESTTTVIIEEGVTSIGKRAFSECSSLTSVTIPNSVTSIGDYAFYDCSSLTSVTIPNSVTSIGFDAFRDCSSLTLVTIPNSVTSIGNRAFSECSSLTSVTIPNSVTSIGEGAFSRVLNIVYSGSAIGSPWGAKSVNGFVDGYLVYSDETKTNLLACSPAFVGELTIPNSVTSIGKSAFSGCSGLTSVTIPNSVTSIGADAFSGCSSLTGVYITDLLAWCNIKFLRDFLSNSSNPLSYAHNLYLNGNLVTDLSIPDGVTSIGEDAFYNCSSLTSVTIPDGVTSIGSDAFYDCTSLTSVTIGSSVTSIGSLAFDGCTSLTSVTIGNSVTSIGSGAFADCSSLTLVTIPNSVTSIGKDAFYNCSSLTGVYITDLVAWCNIKFDRGYYGSDNSNPLSYAHNLYLNGTLVTDLTIPDGVTSISDYAFYGCSSLTSVTIPNSVTSIGSSAFSGCSSLTGVYITDLTAWCNILFSYEANPLSYAHNLYLNGTLVTDLIIPNSVTSIGDYAFDGCSGLTSVTIPNSITSIGDYAFDGCSGLTSVTIPNSVTSIGTRAFADCSSLTSVTIPNSVTSIGSSAFYGCSSLKSVTLEATTPPEVYKSSFPQNQIVYVPLGSLAAYQNTTWKNFDLRVFDMLPTKSESMPTSINISFGDNTTRELIASCGMEGGETFAGNIVEYIGLEPESKYEDVPFFVKTTKDDYMATVLSFTTSSLTLTTQPAKPVSESVAILLAETNMADIETSCGFEWRRYDAPEEMPSNTVWCPVANGLMAGRLKNLKDDAYYKYRAFYKSGAGNMYYGDWVAFGTQDVAVEFDPILYTYEATDVRKTQARLRGYALAGSEDFTEQGFEYWVEGRNTEGSSAKAPQAHKLASGANADDLGVHHTVTASGISMSVSLTNLDEGTVYHYRSYAKVGDKVLYGSEMSFTTQGEYRYTVTFVDYDGTVIDTRQTTYGNSVEAPEAPLHEGLEFVGWDTDFSSVTDDITVKAIYADVVTGIAEQAGQAISTVRKVFDPQTHTIYVLMPDGRIYNLLGAKIR